MATKIYLRRGTFAEASAIVPESGEPLWLTDSGWLYIGDGSTSGGIFIGGAGIGVNTLNDLYGDITMLGGSGIVLAISGNTIEISETAGGLDVDSLNSLVGIVTISGESGITVYEDGNIIVISGQDIGTYVDSLNELTGDVVVSGIGGTVVTLDGQTVLISGGGGSQDFLGLTDTPSDYDDDAGKIVVVNAAEDALEFSNVFNIPSVLTSDHSYVGITCSGIAGEAFEFGELLYYKSDAKWWKANADTESKVDAEIALVVTVSGAADSALTLLNIGNIRDDSWAWTVASGLFVDAVDGDMTHDKPTTSGYFVKRVGWARQSNLVWFNPDGTVLRRGS